MKYSVVLFVIFAFSGVFAQEVDSQNQTSNQTGDSAEVVVSVAPENISAISPVTETEDHIYISVDGSKMNSVADIYNLIAQALKKESIQGSRPFVLTALLNLIGNSQNTSKKLDITITSGASLAQKIGKRAVRELLATLSQAEELNKDDIGISNLSILYWQ